MYTHIRFDVNVEKLSKEEYSFILIDDVLWLDTYILWQRQTTRHSFKAVKYYSRLHTRSCSISENEVVLDDYFKDLALQHLSKIEITKWSEK